MEERHYARSYIYGPTMTAISAEESAAKLLLDASGVVRLHCGPPALHLDSNDESKLHRSEGIALAGARAESEIHQVE